MKRSIAFVTFILVSAALPAATRYVGPQPGDHPTIQAGIGAAAAGDEVVVRDGIYTGGGNTNLSWSGKHITLRSANGPAACVIDCLNENGVRGFLFSDTGQTAADTIAGFTIRGGRSVYPYPEYGGAVYCRNVSPRIVGCVFERNTTGFLGGAVYCEYGTLTVIDCIFAENSAWSFGGGICLSDGASGAVSGCLFARNEGASGGSGVACLGGSFATTISNCVFTANTTSGISYGGAIFCSNANPTVQNCTLYGNTSSGSGGGINCTTAASPTIVNTILWGNSAPYGSQISLGDQTCNPSVVNSCVEGGADGVYQPFGGTYAWENNIVADPQLLDPAAGNCRLGPASPCIDTGRGAGAPPADIDGRPRIDHPGMPDGPAAGVPPVDIGAYERQIWQGDLFPDDEMTINDVLLCLRMVLVMDPLDVPAADLNGDGAVDVADVLLFARRALGA